jgi:uncharacterized protein YgbK (DUF1537 family)
MALNSADMNRKIIILDDDPTGVQTVNNLSVYTDWSEESIEEGFKEENTAFFILTNSRSFTRSRTEVAHREIAMNILKVSEKLGKSFLIISRGDSTLRGHYPLETETIKETLERNSEMSFDGEILIPFFKEGGRLTRDNIHYVKEGDSLIPAGETEFARDKTFGYTESHLGRWIEEKTEGRFKAEAVTYITLEEIREKDIKGITEKLMKVRDFNKVVVNALEDEDLKIFTAALMEAIEKGKNFIFRTAASFTRVISGIEKKGLLNSKDLVKQENNNGGLIIAGSHVKKTSEQLEELRKLKEVEFIEFDVKTVFNDSNLKIEISRVINVCEAAMEAGRTAAVYTTRTLVVSGTGRGEEDLLLSVKISEALTSIVKLLEIKPSYIVAKGGITSSDIGTKGLGVKKAVVAGQIAAGVPVWITGEESKFPGIPYIIFPGNVGSRTTLREVIEALRK